METISNYLETMFMKLPKTDEVMHAKQELLNMMEDKYNELRRDGKTENEAVGTVISEFGNLDELAEALGIQMYMGYTNQSEPDGISRRYVSFDEAKDYIQTTVNASKAIMIGVALCICSPIILILLSGIQEVSSSVSDIVAGGVGVCTLLVFIAIAVAMFIVTGSRTSRYEYLKKEILELDSSTKQYVKNIQEDAKESGVPKIVVGVVLCILAVIPVIIIGTIENNNEDIMSLLGCIGVCVLLFMVSIAVCLFIQAGSTTEACRVLLQEEEYAVQKKDNKIVNVIASIYWPVITCIYLGYSFITMKWGISWVIWPIAGILFGAIAAVCNGVESACRNK